MGLPSPSHYRTLGAVPSILKTWMLGRDKYNGRSTDKIRTKRHVTDHAVSQSDKMAGRKCPVARASEPPLIPSASISCVVVQHRKQGYISSRRSRSGRSSRSSRSGCVRNFDRQDQMLTSLKCNKDKQDQSLVALL